MGGFGERQGVRGGGRNQMVVLHNPAPWGWLSLTLLLRRDGRASRALSLQKNKTHISTIVFLPSPTIIQPFLKTPFYKHLALCLCLRASLQMEA